MAGTVPIRKNRLTSASPSTERLPSPRPKADMIIGPKVYIAHIGTTWHRISNPRNSTRLA